MKTVVKLNRIIICVVLLISALQLSAQGIVVNKTNGKKVYYPAEQVESVTIYGYGEEPEPEPDDLGNAPEGAEAVDLGLPSGTKWANMNLGATAQNEYGLFFAWGETVGFSSSDTSDGRVFDWASYKWMTEGMSSELWINKYQFADNMSEACWYNTNYKFIGDGKTELEAADDAAHTNWGGDWYMPTYDEINELMDNTTSEWTTLKGVSGYKFTSKNNGNAIFLPAAGVLRDSLGLNGRGLYGHYWSSSLITYTYDAGFLGFNWGIARPDYIGERCYGLSVRPVLRK